jgi:RNA polymerase sigma factor (sigma-70 family)
MATAQLETLLRHIRKLAAGRHWTQGTDRQLLEDFSARRDEAAFAALVARHGPMVLRVCRRVLNHEQDAEDAFQATFLVLVQNTKAIRKRVALASWLHGVAYRTAMKAKRSAARRRKHEAERSAMTDKLTATATWDDVQAVLDEEIQRLPEVFRTVFVLCVLEGKNGPEAAAELGLQLGTVSSRLTRARQRLQQRLARRGIELSALLAALAVAESAGKAGVPALLASITVRSGLLVAAGGTTANLIPAQVAALAAGVTRAMFLTKAKIGTAIVLTVSLLAGGAGVLTHQALADKPSQPKAAGPVTQEKQGPAQAEEDKESLTVNGRVLGPDGVPVAGARVYLPHRLKERPQREDDLAMIQRGTTGQHGRFALKLPRKDAQPGGIAAPAVLIAVADGFGLDWVELPQQGAPGDVTFHLLKDVPIRGRILTTEGKPIVGVAVEVIAILVPGKLDDFLKALQREWRAAEMMMSKQLTLPVTKVMRVRASAKDGRFEIAGAGADRLVGIQLMSASFARTHFLVVTREGFDAKAMNEAIAKTGRGAAVSYGPSFDYIAEPNRPIDGTVRETGTGKPVAGATIQVMGNAFVSPVTTDAHGRYRMLGLRRAQQYTLTVTPPANMPLIGRSVNLPDASNSLDPIHADVELPRGVIVTGRVSDKATGKGVESAVSFIALPGNPLYTNNALGNLYLGASTDPDGRFRLVTIPGPGVLQAQVSGTRETSNGVRLHPYPINRYKAAEFDAAFRKRVKQPDQFFQFANACKILDLKEGGDAVTCELVVDPGKTLAVHIEDPDGKPLAGTIASGVTVMPLGAISLKDADCLVYALDPEKPRRLVLLHPERQLAAVVTLRGDEKGPLTVRLGRTGTLLGRLLDQDGQLISGASVAALYEGQVGNDLARELRRRYELPRTDDQGRFRLTGIVPGSKFDLGFVKGRERLKPETQLEIKPLAAGKSLNLGDIRVKPQP